MWGLIGRVWNGVLDLIYPPKCPFCEKLLEKSSDGYCPECQKELPWLLGESGVQSAPFFSKCVSPLRYQDAVRDSIRRYKFRGRTGYAKVYGELMRQCVEEHLKGKYDLITWVPLSKKRYRSRGYDQSYLLAKEVAKQLDMPLVSALKKVRDTPAQSGIQESSARRANVLGAYIFLDKSLIEGKRVLLVDDVITSSSTLSECACMLRTGGARNIVCATLARAR